MCKIRLLVKKEKKLPVPHGFVNLFHFKFNAINESESLVKYFLSTDMRDNVLKERCTTDTILSKKYHRR